MNDDTKAAMITDFAGQRLTTVTVTEALELTTEDGWLITIENDYELTRPGQPSLRTTDGQEPAIQALLDAMVGRPLVGLAYTSRGDLTVHLPDGSLSVSSTPAFEAWSIVGPNQERVIAMPGGELAIWS
ncbi:DUF6188 family protein [Nocardioides speluncae]|uniref:DUF6188 family protein n=1 Tax=Nocardioides speluncae TaxID=2670337 RepID=UPI000D68970B|nr:DUF6188 family protein [Nocardioides speluncae]